MHIPLQDLENGLLSTLTDVSGLVLLFVVQPGIRMFLSSINLTSWGLHFYSLATDLSSLFQDAKASGSQIDTKTQNPQKQQHQIDSFIN